ncbi:MAG: L-Ala-D/L-Glu epimerase [Spirochaetota bacterium]
MSKIKDLKFNLKTYNYNKPFHITGGISNTSTNIEILLVLENGIKGYGEASPSFRVSGEKPEMIMSLENFVRQTLIGLNVKEYRKIFDITDKLFATPSLKAALQYAVIDALTENIGIEVYQFFGGLLNKICTDKTVGIDKKENRIKEFNNILKSGFDVVKIKVGENLKEDIDFMLQIKKILGEIGSNVKLIVDANMGYTVKEAINFAKTIYSHGIDINVFEQPVHMKDFDGLKFVRSSIAFPVAADESAKTKYDVLNLIKMDAVDYINIKLMKSGISDALAIVEMAKTANKRLMIGCMGESSIGINQSVHFALGLGAFDFCDLDSHLMMVDDQFRGKFIQDGAMMKARS